MENIFLLCTFLIFVYMTLLYIGAIINKRNDLADVGWGIGFIIVAVFSLQYFETLNSFYPFRNIIVTLLVLVWGTRLAFYIYKRNKNKTEDPRYAKWREEWGRFFYIRSYLQVFLLQGLLLLLVSVPVMFMSIYNSSEALNTLDIIGISVWVVGFLFESVGDRQLANFLKKPENKGHIMQSGLWSYTRHPNYFGEVTMWWGIWIIAMSSGVPFISVVGPLTITYLITKVSGIPMTEKRYEGNMEFEEYKKRVSALVPLHPGKKLFGNFKNSKL